jgi:hypothetical protein
VKEKNRSGHDRKEEARRETKSKRMRQRERKEEEVDMKKGDQRKEKTGRTERRRI